MGSGGGDTASSGSKDPYLDNRAQRERETAEALRGDLADYVELSDCVMSAVTKIIVEYRVDGAGSESAFVLTLMLARLLNDQQSCVRDAREGYVLQAVSTAAGMLELANAAAFIGSDEKRAGRWLSHTDLKHSYPTSARDAIHATCQLLSLDKAAEDREYENYSRLCMAKHSNPIALSQLGVQIEDGQPPRIHIGPYYDAGVVRAARSAVAAATRASWLAAKAFVHHHAPAGRRSAIEQDLAPFGEQMLTLGERDKGA
jgi:hypothetical protein